MAPETVGAIFGNVGTTEFRFEVHDPALKRLDYVKVAHPTDGWVVAQVVEVLRESRGGEERLLGHARVVGYRDDRGLLQAPRTPFEANATVVRADDGAVADVFGLHAADDGAYLGLVRGYALPVHLDINALVQKHVSVLAKTGSGKSYVVGVLMEELIKRGVPIVVIDPHGEHASLARPNTKKGDSSGMRRFGVRPRGYGEHVVEYTPDPDTHPELAPYTVSGVNLEARDIADLLGGDLTNTQMGILHQAVKKLQEADEPYTVADVVEKVSATKSSAKWGLVSTLETIVEVGFLSEKGTPPESLVKKNKVSVLNLKGLDPKFQDVLASRLVRSLFEARKLNTVPPFMLVVEEAHNFCPERGLQSTLCGDALRTVASEGRKFGMGLTIITQRPAKVDKNVLSQAGTQIILKVTNPNDLKAIGASVEGLTSETEQEISRLPVGVALVSHGPIAMPLLVEVRPRETAHGGESVDVTADWVAEADEETAPKVLPNREDEEEADEEEVPVEETRPPPPPPPEPKPTPAPEPKAAPEPEPEESTRPPRLPPKRAKTRHPKASIFGIDHPLLGEVRGALALVDVHRLHALNADQLSRLHGELKGYVAQVERLSDDERALDRATVKQLEETTDAVARALRKRRGLLGGWRERLTRS